MQTNTNPRKFKVSIWNISEPVADFLFNLSNAVLILGAFLVFTGTIGSIWMQAAKSYFSDERIAANEAATARAKADAEIAREGAEAAHAKALADIRRIAGRFVGFSVPSRRAARKFNR